MKVASAYTLKQVAEYLQADLIGDAQLILTGLATLQDATPKDLSFLANPAYRKYLATSKAGAVILNPDMAAQFSGNVIVVANPYLAYAKISHLFDSSRQFETGIHPSAVVHHTVELADSVYIGPNVVIESGVTIGEHAVIESGSVVGRDSLIGAYTHISRNVTICYGVTVGERVIIHSGAVIGADGFGFAPEQHQWQKIAQLGSVIIGDDVEIGANTAIDRGALSDTIIGNGVKLDNLIQIAHNVVIGENTAIAGCVGISGSTTVGKNCTIAGGSGLAGHLKITDNVHITAMTLVTKSIDQPGTYSSGAGTSMPAAQWKKQVVRIRQLDELAKRIHQLEKRNEH
ncbi:UDP-3-O-(3-hydroxymyristoyl)glucosamine N-acyltransferase [Zooshikella sp. RANM57]|uniref:UDP-3-O-(3-hydroxymyristoyl)glucosamine N-acyltransferase n=1 Tax=Zooshikella sp. RANM57 TaxID=3425863 RepID=UPI003D6EF6D2